MRQQILALILAVLTGWWVNGLRLGEQMAQADLARSKAQKEATERVRDIELSWQMKLEGVRINAQARIDQAFTDGVESRVAADRVRREIADRTKSVTQSSTTLAPGSAALSTLILYSDLLSQCVERAEQLAGEADTRRNAGLTCEAEHDAQLLENTSVTY